MSRSHHRGPGSPAQEPTTEANPSVAAEDENERRSRQALVDYFRILQEWSLKAQPQGLVGDERVVSGAGPKVRKRSSSFCGCPKFVYKYRTMPELKHSIADRISSAPTTQVWTPVDFLDLGSRDAVDKALQRLVQAGRLRRIDRGLYDTPRINNLTKRPAVADYRQIIDALARRDQVRMLVDGLTAANDLGLTTAVPAHVVIHTDARRRTIHLDNLAIEFKQTAPSKLYWAGRPAMRIVQALRWLKDILPTNRDRTLAQLSIILNDRRHGKAIRDDLRTGIGTLPAWMQAIIRELLNADTSRSTSPSRGHRTRGTKMRPKKRPAAVHP